MNALLSVAGGVQFSITSNAVTLNQPHHFCYNARNNTSYIYLANVLVNSSAGIIDFNNHSYDALTISCDEER